MMTETAYDNSGYRYVVIRTLDGWHTKVDTRLDDFAAVLDSNGGVVHYCITTNPESEYEEKIIIPSTATAIVRMFN